MDDEGEFSALRASFGQQLARQPWPIEGDTLVMSSDWNGPKLFGSNVFLNLYQGEKVLVTHRNREGLLYGSVVDAASDRSGWFGGKGCQAAVEVVLPVPLGPAHALSSLPMGPPDIDLPIGAEEDDPEVEAYILRHGIDSAAAQALWELEPGLRSQVIQSDLTNCRNPSAVLLCRIDRVRGTAVPTPAPPRGPKHVPAPPPPQALKAPTHQLRSRSPPRRAPVAVQQAPPPPPLPSMPLLLLDWRMALCLAWRMGLCPQNPELLATGSLAIVAEQRPCGLKSAASRARRLCLRRERRLCGGVDEGVQRSVHENLLWVVLLPERQELQPRLATVCRAVCLRRPRDVLLTQRLAKVGPPFETLPHLDDGIHELLAAWLQV
mmetsp:Transcript_91533/g.267848  ORF Transcript_91533/g.267848 Transcript_91533/m.267848 type:complete len:378 (-) Transcript_91533:1111-2244(-)